MTPEIQQQMQEKLQQFRAGKQNVPIATPQASPAPSVPVNQTAPLNASIDASLAKYRASGSNVAPSNNTPHGNMLGSLAKGIFGAPATMIARPFQAAAAITGDLAGQDITPEIDAFSSKISGGLIAPTPKNYNDVKQDVGRGIQTVALGADAPIAAGSAFGFGSSLEQGNNVFSPQTVIDTALGGVGGKLLGFVGKPLLDVSGKVIGTITPQIIKDVSTGGAEAVQKFMQQNKLLGGVAAPVSEKISNGMRAVDNTVNTGAKKIFSGTTNSAGGLLKSQYPNFDINKYYTDVNTKDLLRPTTMNSASYGKAQNIAKDAAARNIDLGKVAAEKGVNVSKLENAGKYDTKDTATQIIDNSFKDNPVEREAIKVAQNAPGVQRVPLQTVRDAMFQKIDSIPASEIDPVERAAMKAQIAKRYADGGAFAQQNPNGFDLTSLHDNRIVAGKNGKYKAGADPSSAMKAELSRQEARVYAKLFDQNVPANSGLTEYRKSLEETYKLADYLKALHGKKIPAGVVRKTAQLFGRTTAAILGGKIAGYPGAIIGSNVGNSMFDSFASLPNPIKSAVLNSLKLQKSPVVAQLEQYLGKAEAAKLLQKALPKPGKSSYQPPASEPLFSTPGGKASAVQQEAVDMNSIESGAAKAPTAGPLYKQKLSEIQSKVEPYLTPQEMAIIDFGKKEKSDTGLPTATTPPNVYAPSQSVYNALQKKLEKYLTPEEMAIIDFGPKPKGRLFNGPTIR